MRVSEKPKLDQDIFKGKLLEDEDDLPIEEEDDEGIETGEDNNDFDEKEQEAREAVAEKFDEIIEDLRKVNKSLEILMNSSPQFIAGKYRVEIKEDMFNNILKMDKLNELTSKSKIYLKMYIYFGKEATPNFDYIKNLIFLFQQKLMEEQARRFAIVQKNTYKKRYISKPLIDYYLKGIHIWISRIIGALDSGADYIVTVPPRREDRMGSGLEGEDRGELGAQEGYAGRDDYIDDDMKYANSDRWWERGIGTSYTKSGSRVRPKLREFGDPNTK